MLALVLAAVSVGIDNFGAAAALGMAGVDRSLRLRVAFTFGLFEGLAPVAGLLLGHSLARRLGGQAHLIGGIAIAATGLYMIVGQLLGERRSPGRARHEAAARSTRRLIVLGAVLSIDNLAIGFGLGTYHVTLALALVVMASTSGLLTMAGLELGTRLARHLERWSELASGLLLVGLGIALAGGAL